MFCLPISSNWPNGKIPKVARRLLLIAREGGHRLLQIAGHQELHAVAVKPNQLPQKADRQQVLPLLLLLDDDLGQDRAGDVFAGLGVVDHEIAAFLDHRGEIVERHIAARRRVVEPAIGVFLDDNRLLVAARLLAARIGHAPLIPPDRRCCYATIQRFVRSASSNTWNRDAPGCRDGGYAL
jgi:hypothetical protein